MSEKIYIPNEFYALEENADPRGMAVECDAGQVSDGYHTFDELYEHRYLLFCLAATALVKSNCLYVWKSKTHWIDGNIEPCWDGWFVAGIELNHFDGPARNQTRKMITYHLPLSYWELFDGIEREQAPPHDGHTSKDVILRLKEFLTL